MDIRETLNQKRGLTTGVSLVIAVLAMGFVIYQIKTGGPPSQGNAYFTIDDGQTWFSGDSSKLPPFDKGGQQAVRAVLYKTSKGEEFVGYMEKYSDRIKKQIETNKANHTPWMDLLDPENMLVKKPGAGNKWLGPHDAGYQNVHQVTAPDGSSTVEPVEP